MLILLYSALALAWAIFCVPALVKIYDYHHGNVKEEESIGITPGVVAHRRFESSRLHELKNAYAIITGCTLVVFFLWAFVAECASDLNEQLARRDAARQQAPPFHCTHNEQEMTISQFLRHYTTSTYTLTGECDEYYKRVSADVSIHPLDAFVKVFVRPFVVIAEFTGLVLSTFVASLSFLNATVLWGLFIACGALVSLMFPYLSSLPAILSVCAYLRRPAADANTQHQPYFQQLHHHRPRTPQLPPPTSYFIHESMPHFQMMLKGKEDL